MTTKESPYAKILMAIAAGEDIQWRPTTTSNFRAQGNATTLREIADEAYGPDCYRVKPDGIEVNGFVIPRPLKAPPPCDALYWYLSSNTESGYYCSQWTDHGLDHNRLKNRQIWATEEGVRQAVQALTDLLST
jgi:hypothetical protein